MKLEGWSAAWLTWKTINYENRVIHSWILSLHCIHCITHIFRHGVRTLVILVICLPLMLCEIGHTHTKPKKSGKRPQDQPPLPTTRGSLQYASWFYKFFPEPKNMLKKNIQSQTRTGVGAAIRGWSSGGRGADPEAGAHSGPERVESAPKLYIIWNVRLN